MRHNADRRSANVDLDVYRLKIRPRNTGDRDKIQQNARLPVLAHE